MAASQLGQEQRELDLDPAAAVIKCKERLKSSDTWGEVCESVDLLLSSELSDGLQSFEKLDEAEKTSLIIKTTNELERNGQLEAMKAEVRQSLKENLRLGPGGHLASHRSDQADDHPGHRQLSGMCQYLLLKWPHLSQKLSRCVLTILPTHLRVFLWHYCLSLSKSNHTSDHQGTLNGGDHPGIFPNSSELAQICSQQLLASPLLSFMLNWTSAVKVMAASLSSWMQQEGRVLEDYEVLLVVPFVWVNLKSILDTTWEEIERTNTHHFVIYMYIQFMRSRPWYIHDLSMPVCHDATTKLVGAVNSLLIGADPELHSSLCNSLTVPVQTTGGSPLQSDVFVREFRALLHPLLKCFFVGVVPMETVCMLMDQQVLTVIFPSYDPLPYFVTSMLLLAKRDLLRCRNPSQVNTAFTQVLARLTPHVLLDKVKHHYGNQMRSHVNVSHKMADSSVESYQLRFQVHRLEEMLLMRDAVAMQQDVATLPHTPPQTSPGSHLSVSARTSTLTHPVTHPVTQTITEPSPSVLSSTRTAQSDLRHLSSVAGDSRRETAATRHTVVSQSSNQPTRTSGQQSHRDRVLASQPPAPDTIHEVDPGIPVHTPSVVETPPVVVATPPLPHSQTPLSHSAVSLEVLNGNHDNSLSRVRVQDFWLHILTRFSDAADLLFKGTDEEAQELSTQLNS